MKQSLDFTEIKEFCDKVGLNCQIIDEGVIITKPKDIWDGVDFYSDHLGVVRKMTDDVLKVIRGGVKLLLHPSTEQAYVEQLKKESKDRFGEIKEGDRFNRYGLGRPDQSMIGVIGDWSSPKGFRYYKDEDYLSFNGTMIYRQGKWAERVKERLSGEYVRYHILWPKEDGATLGYSFKGFANKEGLLPIDKLEDAGKFLAQQLESFLNLEKHEIIGSGDVISIHLKVDNNKTHNFERIKEAVIKFAEELK